MWSLMWCSQLRQDYDTETPRTPAVLGEWQSLIIVYSWRISRQKYRLILSYLITQFTEQH